MGLPSSLLLFSNTTLATVQLHTITMIVHAAPSQVLHELKDLQGCGNDESSRKDVEVNVLNKSDHDSHDESSRASLKEIEVNALNKSDDHSRDESSRKDVKVNALNKSDHDSH